MYLRQKEAPTAIPNTTQEAAPVAAEPAKVEATTPEDDDLPF